MHAADTSAANARSRADLAAFSGSLDEAGLATDVGDGWTVAMALAHTAFWDLHTAEQWRRRGDLVTPATETYDTADIVNSALDPLLAAIPGTEAIRLVLAAADEVDAVVAALPDAAIDAIRAEDRGWMVDAWEHRDEHIAQANRGLGRS